MADHRNSGPASAALRACLLAAASLSTGAAFAQAFPAKPIRIVTSEPGGGTDLVTRVIAQGIAGPLGQPVLVENRPSALVGGTVAKAPPDGYMILLNGNSTWISFLVQTPTYDPVKDLSPLTLATRAASILAVHPSVPANTVKELIDLAKAKPGVLNYSSAGPGGAPHLGAELFKSLAAADIVGVHYRGNVQALGAVVAGQAQMTFGTAGTVAPMLKAGKLKGLGVTTPQPSALFPDLPTIAATLPGYSLTSYYGMFAPARTPAPVISRLNQEIVALLKTPEARQRLLNSGVEPVGSTPAELGAVVESELAIFGKVVKEAGIRAE